MQLSLREVINNVIAKGAGNTLFGKEGKLRGPKATLDFIYECMIGVALELTDYLPYMFEQERIRYEQQKEHFRKYGVKGKYTDSYGWSRSRERKHDFEFDPVFFHYFNRIIVPFLGGQKKSWHNENSKIWKWIKKMIIEGDKVKIAKLQKGIRERILKESKKKIVGAVPNGSNFKESLKNGTI